MSHKNGERAGGQARWRTKKPCRRLLSTQLRNLSTSAAPGGGRPYFSCLADPISRTAPSRVRMYVYVSVRARQRHPDRA